MALGICHCRVLQEGCFLLARYPCIYAYHQSKDRATPFFWADLNTAGIEGPHTDRGKLVAQHRLPPRRMELAIFGSKSDKISQENKCPGAVLKIAPTCNPQPTL